MKIVPDYPYSDGADAVAFCETVNFNLDSDCEVLVAPAFIGSDTYADKLLVGAKASSAIYGYKPHKGHVSTETLYLN